MSEERVEALTEEVCDNAEGEERYILTPWGCLYAVLLDYGVRISLSDGREISGKVGEHIMQDLFGVLCKMGYLAEKDEEEVGD